MRIVVKLGSSLVATSKGAVRRSLLAARATEVAALVAGGHSVCIVSSGAIALGAPRLGFARRPSTMRQLQAASAVGQAQLQQAWERAFSRVGLQAAQILLSPADVADRQTYVNVCNTFDALFRLGAVPVVNENDATATDEITFGDNDALAAQVAVLTDARLLVLLTEVDGVYSRAPGTPGAELLDDGSLTSVGPPRPRDRSRPGRHGEQDRGCGARGGRGHPDRDRVRPGRDGARSRSSPGNAEAPASRAARLRASRPSSSGSDTGSGPVGPSCSMRVRSVRCVVAGASVLAVGVTACDGGFGPGDAIELVSATGVPIGKGIASIAAAEVGSRERGLEVVNRDRLVLY